MPNGLKQLLGIVGLIALAVYGPTILQNARRYSPFSVLPRVFSAPEPRSLIVLGLIVVGILLLVKKCRK